MDKKTKILTFAAVALMFAVCFIGFVAIGDDAVDADGSNNQGGQIVIDPNDPIIVQEGNDQVVAMIGDRPFSTLDGAVGAVQADDDVITLIKNVETDSTININKKITLDLNGYNITFNNEATTSDNTRFIIKGGNLSIIGKGVISEKNPFHAPIMLNGSTDNTPNYSVVTVGKDVTLIGWSGIFFRQTTDNNAPSDYGMVANLYGTINYKKDATGDDGAGIYVNGIIGSKSFNANNLYPVVNIYDSAKIFGDGLGIYAAGYARWTINGANIEGTQAAIEIHAGELTIKDGSFKSTATEFSCNPNGNGSTTTGAAIAIAQHTTKRNITVNISGGTFEGLRALNESNPQNNDPVPQVNLSVIGGTFKGMIAITDKDKANISVEYAFIVESEGEKRWYFDDSEIVNAVKWINEITSGDVMLEIFENINITEAGTAQHAALWFTKGVTINGNDNVITYNATRENGLNVLGFNKDVTATVKNLTIDGNEKAFHGINIWKATKISLDNVIVKNVNAAGIIANCAETTMKNCDVSQNCAQGGVNVDIGSSGATTCKLTVTGDFKGMIWTETLDNPSKVDYDNAIVTATYNNGAKNWKFWYSPGYDFTPYMRLLPSGAEIVLNDDLTLSNEKPIFLNHGVKLKISDGKTFNGIIHDSDANGHPSNGLLANGLKAGEGGITITGGSLIINGKIVDASGVEGNVTVTVEGNEIYINGSLEPGAMIQISGNTAVTIKDEESFVSKGVIINEGTIINNGTFTNEYKLIMAGDDAMINGKDIINNGVIIDKRNKGAEIVPIDTDSKGIIISKKNSKLYEDEGFEAVAQNPDIDVKPEGMIEVDINKFAFIDPITTTGKLDIVMNDGNRQYTITIPEGTMIALGTVITVKFIEHQSFATKYYINTPGIENFSVKLPCQIGFKKAKVLCDDSELGISEVRYNKGTGYVTFDAAHNSVFTIVLSEASPANVTTTSGGNATNDYSLVIAFVVLVASLGFLVYVIRKKQ